MTKGLCWSQTDKDDGRDIGDGSRGTPKCLVPRSERTSTVRPSPRLVGCVTRDPLPDVGRSGQVGDSDEVVGRRQTGA